MERYNKEINRHLRAVTFDNNSLNDYKISLPFVQRILNSNHSDRLKISASQYAQFRQRFLAPVSEITPSIEPLSSYMSKLLSVQDNLPKASAKELLRTDLLHMTSKEQEKHQEYLPGSFVLVHYRTGLPPSRLRTSLRSPMRVIKGLNSRYILLDLMTGKETDFHVSDIKPFVFDSAVTNQQDISRRDRMEFFIEKILSHRSTIQKRKDLKFLVRWVGHSDSDDTWELYSALRNCIPLHLYL